MQGEGGGRGMEDARCSSEHGKWDEMKSIGKCEKPMQLQLPFSAKKHFNILKINFTRMSWPSFIVC